MTLSPAALLALLLCAPPEVRLEEGAPAEAAALLQEGWAEIEALAAREGLRPPAAVRPVAVGVAPDLPPGVAARSRQGRVGLRTGLAPGEPTALAVRHEAAHLFLLEACPAAEGDRLFHEAFALAASGELPAWQRSDEERYLPLAQALGDLAAADPDVPRGRRALARLLAEGPARPGRLPPVLARRLAACEAGARWAPLSAEELATDPAPAADALVVLSRHTGEVLHREGAAALPMPFGSTLKPFLVAGAPGPTPRLEPRPALPGWRCGDGVGERMDAATALLRSCNGWFLDWAAAEPRAAAMGPWGAVLAGLGLSAPPADAAEAIGIRSSLRLSPLALAEAYRLLAEARPDLVDVLSRSAREGTLSGLPASPSLAGLAAKTGTVLDATGSPRLGWIAGVDRDVVLVMARAGRPPRAFATPFAEAVARWRAHRLRPARVQVFGLVGASEVRGRCEGRGFSVARGTPRPLPDAEAPLLEAARGGALVCLGGAWQVRLPGSRTPRPYAGVFTVDAAPPTPQPPGATARERRARRGSDLVFRTTRLAYAAGVVAAEDARGRGEPRVALARVADANVAHSRHRGRPVCDTTHCQVFLGTAPPGPEERRALASPLRAGRWLPFSRGGSEPWRAVRSLGEVQAALGPGARALAFERGKVSFIASAGDGAERWEERRQLPCEALRGPLKLLSCPTRAELRGDRYLFEGRGQGHGEGLDVSWASRSGLGAEAILERAFGAPERTTR